MSSQRKKYQTQWASQFFAAAELIRRGDQVALTLGNAPVTDLLVVSPEGIHTRNTSKHLGVDVEIKPEHLDRIRKTATKIIKSVEVDDEISV